ncbi:hypothetical protein [Alkalihalobacillus trypoxylicola]|uniref:Uncharacterized protein n=1 Tax=Alkalihalobacillus trypoxylicola TaxID=519424 RepID=A0A162F708_9BACI|nr:hypothetical protein [Alkalihalobacillus trypoxylicola]KYG34939.1 hypothetical protein AZF04_00990 [Alkalihalobacillus trypoxylicola]
MGQGMKFLKEILDHLLEARNKKQWKLLTFNHLTKQMELETLVEIHLNGLKQLHYQNIAEFKHVEFASDFYY